MRRSRSTFIQLFVAVPLFLGAAIYLLWRADTLVAFQWLAFIGMTEPAQMLRTSTGAWPGPQWALFTLPGGLWTFAATNALGAIWLADWRPEAKYWITLPLLYACGNEGAQFMHQLAGTYSTFDLLAYFTGWAGSVFVITKYRNTEIPVED